MVSEQVKFSRPPIDRLFFGCVLGASLAYVVFLIVMPLLGGEAEGPDRQGYLGVVSGESEPSGLGGESDPATGVAEVGGKRRGYYISNGQAPRPVTLAEGAADEQGHTKLGTPTLIPARRFDEPEPKPEPKPESEPESSAPKPASLVRLALDGAAAGCTAHAQDPGSMR